MAEDSITVTLAGSENVQWIRDKVRTGEFDSESDFIRQSIDALREDDTEYEGWLLTEIGARYDAFMANPDSAIPIEQVRKNLQRLREKRTRAE